MQRRDGRCLSGPVSPSEFQSRHSKFHYKKLLFNRRHSAAANYAKQRKAKASDT